MHILFNFGFDILCLVFHWLLWINSERNSERLTTCSITFLRHYALFEFSLGIWSG